MSKVLSFYRGEGTDARGRTLASYFDENDDWWERCHNHVQWAFPLPEPSKAQPSSPVATDADYDAIEDDPVLKARMVSMLGRYIVFLERTMAWRQPMDHNHLRITRVIRCLCRCGLLDMAFEFNRYVQKVVGEAVGEKTCWFWDEALKRNPAWLIKEIP